MGRSLHGTRRLAQGQAGHDNGVRGSGRSSLSDTLADASASGPQGRRLRDQGEHSRKGEKVFHVPGSRDYDRTRISEKDGERMFCSEDEAKAAGWRAPR